MLDYHLFPFSVSEIESVNLKKGIFFNPDPYLKLTVQPGKLCRRQSHHESELRTQVAENTTCPKWHDHVSSVCLLWVSIMFQQDFS